MKKLHDCMVPDLGLVVRDSHRYRQLIARSLPEELVDQILFVRVAQGCARITVASSAFAARLRFFQREIRHQIGSQVQINQLSVHVLPAGTTLPQPRSSQRDKPRATSKTIAGIEQTAHSMDDADLKLSLQRLARNLETKD